MHDRTREYRKGLATVFALPQTSLSLLACTGLTADTITGLDEIVLIDAATVGANGLALPAKLLKELVGGGLCGDSLCDLWKGHFLHVPVIAGYGKLHIAQISW
jgi:hypothetical protein